MDATGFAGATGATGAGATGAIGAGATGAIGFADAMGASGSVAATAFAGATGAVATAAVGSAVAAGVAALQPLNKDTAESRPNTRTDWSVLCMWFLIGAIW